jgi:hypothetical protein
MRCGDYGYDAPYALVTFGLLAVGSGIWAAMAWLDGPIRAEITAHSCKHMATTRGSILAFTKHLK